jgi:outer membrane protein insertion porin family
LNQAITYRQYKTNDYLLGGALAFENGTGTSNNLSYSISLGRNSSGPSRIFPTMGSEFSFGAKFTLPHSLLTGKDYSNIEDLDEFKTAPDTNGNGVLDDGDLGVDSEGNDIRVSNTGKINQEKFEWLEYYKLTYKAKWYTSLIGKLVLMTNTELGYLGAYNSDLKDIPFERYFVGGDGLQQGQFDGREVVGLRGYENSSLSGNIGGKVYNKFTLELRYPITLKPSASIYALGFAEAGNSYEDFEAFNPFDVKKSAGIGIRIFMPAFGLLGIDFAHGFDATPFSTEKSGWQTHFIIGQQF